MDILFTVKEGEEYLTQLEFINNRIYEVIYILVNDIDEKISQIANCKSFDESLVHFDHIRNTLPFIYKCHTKYNFQLSDKTLKIIDDFERTHISSIQRNLWEKISSGTYQF